jgi:PAS domain S-box-containing protein
MSPLTRLRFPTAAAVEQWPWAARASLGCVAACLAVAITYSVHPLRPFPLLLSFPMVVLSCWFLGMWGGASCAVTAAVLVDSFLTQAQARFSVGNTRESLRLSMFLLVSILLGWTIRRLAQQRSQLATQQLEQRLTLADAQRQLAEERAAAAAALRERDELLQLALHANGMGLWVWDMEKGTVHRSDEMYRMVGREPGAFGNEPEIWLEFLHPEDRPGLVETFEQIHATAADYHRQYRVVWPDGSVHWLESQGKCQTGADGRVTRVMGVIADITHRKKTEEAMLRAEKLAVAGKLAASVAHEINNPLAAVANLLYLVTMTDSAEAARAQAGKALEELMRVSMITQQTLKFHRQAGSPKDTRLTEMIDSLLTLFRGKLLAAQVAVEVRVDEESAVPCMPGEIQQILANLFSNAVEAMPRGGRLVIRIRPSADWRDSSIRGMRVTLCDSGAGMDRATMRRVFEPFFTTKPETGTGLGLWVVSQLIERHRGHVRVWSSQSVHSSGTAFSVFLPFVGVPSGEVSSESETADIQPLQAEMTR